MKKILVAYRVDKSNKNERGIYLKMLSIAQTFSALGYNANIFYLDGKHVYLNNYIIKNNIFTKDQYFIQLSKYLIKEKYHFLYLRFSPFSFFLGKEMKKVKNSNKQLKILLELPTHPFINEYKGLKKGILSAYLSKRWKINDWANFILHLGLEKSLYGVPTISVENGILVDSINKKDIIPNDFEVINLICVTKLWKWQGLDILIGEIAKYYQGKKEDNSLVKLQIIGDGPELGNLKNLTSKLNLNEVIKFRGALYDDGLDVFFNKADIAIGVIKDEVRELKSVSALKHRSYAARGIPFVYGIPDRAFNNQKGAFFLKDNFELGDIIHWYKSEIFPNYKKESILLREFAKRELSWAKILEKMLAGVENIKGI